jgi:hypothetical protein
MPDEPMIQETRVKTWDGLMAAIRQLKPNWIFRGHQDADWTLQTTLERSGSVAPRLDEQSLLQRFQRRARAHLPISSVPNDDGDPFAWWSIMQHYGAPTRLLDFTESPYVALFFAIEKVNETRNGERADRALWAIDAFHCRKRASMLVAQEFEIHDYEAIGLVYDPRALLAGKEEADTRSFLGVVPCEPWNLDVRQAAQQTVLLMPGRADRSLMWNLAQMEPCPGLARKIVFPDALRLEILEELNAMNVTAASLFPGLDGFARSMHSHLLLKLATLGELAAVLGLTTEKTAES